MLGDFDLYALIRIGPIIGPLFLFSYIYFVYFVLLNMFLAIISDAYSRVASVSTHQGAGIKNLPMALNRLFSRKKSIDYRTILKV